MPPPAAPTLRLVLTAVDSEERAEALARGLVQDRLAACVSVVGPVRSLYVWKGKHERAAEWLLLVKTDEARLGALREAIAHRHPYEVPEILTAPPVEGSGPYAAWVEEVLGTDAGTPEKGGP